MVLCQLPSSSSSSASSSGPQPPTPDGSVARRTGIYSALIMGRARGRARIRSCFPAWAISTIPRKVCFLSHMTRSPHVHLVRCWLAGAFGGAGVAAAAVAADLLLLLACWLADLALLVACLARACCPSWCCCYCCYPSLLTNSSSTPVSQVAFHAWNAK